MTIVILGCGGFIGSHLIRKLLSDSELDIIGYDVNDYKIHEHLLHPRFNFRKENIYESTSLETDIEGAYSVVFLASLCNPSLYITRPVETIWSNFLNPSKIIDLCTKYKIWLTAFSSCEVYGRTLSSYVKNNNEEFFLQKERETPCLLGPTVNTRWCYAAAKQLMEHYILANSREKDLPFTILRPYNFFGPRMDYVPGVDGNGIPRVLACFFNALRTGNPIKVVDGGSAKRVLTYIDDAINAIFKVILNPDKSIGEIFNIGNPENEISILDLAKLMRTTYAEITGKNKYAEHPIMNVSARDFYGDGYEDCNRRVPDISNAKKKLGWIPTIDLETTVKRTLEFYNNKYKLANID